MGQLGPGTLPPPNSGPSQEDLENIILILVHQLGGSVVLDGADFAIATSRKKAVRIITQKDPWQLILREVDVP
jgi:hypothetical protein